MLASVAQRSGYRVHVYAPENDGPANSFAHRTFIADYRDPAAMESFAKSVDVVTTEFENIPTESLTRAAEFTRVHPSANCLGIAQNRIVEKTTISELGFPVSPFHPVRSKVDLMEAEQKLGFPMVLKTASWGYDGKGQRKVLDRLEAERAFDLLGPEPVVAERWVTFLAEVSVLVARNLCGDIACYPVLENSHSNHILDITKCPCSPEFGKAADSATEIAKALVAEIDYVGLLCVEFFVVDGSSVCINEIAPRPHNSGHLTIEAAATSQFEQQLRSICNLSLGCTNLQSPAAMANLLGDLWHSGLPRFENAFGEKDCFLHLYGKLEAKPGRKMGHLTCLADSANEAVRRVSAIRDHLDSRSPNLFLQR